MKRFLWRLVPWNAILISSTALADDGVWERISNPYKIGTVEEISIGYAQDQTQYIFAATS